MDFFVFRLNKFHLFVYFTLLKPVRTADYCLQRPESGTTWNDNSLLHDISAAVFLNVCHTAYFCNEVIFSAQLFGTDPGTKDQTGAINRTGSWSSTVSPKQEEEERHPKWVYSQNTDELFRFSSIEKFLWFQTWQQKCLLEFRIWYNVTADVWAECFHWWRKSLRQINVSLKELWFTKDESVSWIRT